jgi:hypothetical protein
MESASSKFAQEIAILMLVMSTRSGRYTDTKEVCFAMNVSPSYSTRVDDTEYTGKL